MQLPPPLSAFPWFPTLCLGIAASLGVAGSLAQPAAPAAPPRNAVLLRPKPRPAPGATSGPPPTNLAELRARGPAALNELLAHYDHLLARNAAMDPGWEPAIDEVAGQHYATISRLYWYTDLAAAEQEAHRLHRPILALRMLGDLRDDLSCANSRLFRATLYANRELSAFLRANFVLYWSSERPVPTVTIDFGDGRKLVRTTTGNSAHYVLDEDGHVLDVLPGLYAAFVFQTELTKSLAFAGRVRGMTDAARIRETVAYHTAGIQATDRTWIERAPASYLRGPQTVHGSNEALARAQRAAASKAGIETPDLIAIGLLQPGDMAADGPEWKAIGERVWGLVGGNPAAARPAAAAHPILDEQSEELVAMLHDAGPAEQSATAGQLASVITRLEQHIAADTALNELWLRQTIRRHIVDQAVTDFASLNAWIYEDVFATPKADPWLGLRARTTFTGLPGDGVVQP